MDPGNARSVPVPIRFLRRLVTNAIPTAYPGPRKTPPSMLIKCWTGAHFDAPTGIDNGEQTIPTATSMPARASFFTLTFFTVFIFNLSTSCTRAPAATSTKTAGCTGGRCSLASSHSGTRIPSHVVFVLKQASAHGRQPRRGRSICSGVQLKPGRRSPPGKTFIQLSCIMLPRSANKSNKTQKRSCRPEYSDQH